MILTNCFRYPLSLLCLSHRNGSITNESLCITFSLGKEYMNIYIPSHATGPILLLCFGIVWPTKSKRTQRCRVKNNQQLCDLARLRLASCAWDPGWSMHQNTTTKGKNTDVSNTKMALSPHTLGGTSILCLAMTHIRCNLATCSMCGTWNHAGVRRYRRPQECCLI